MYSPARLCLFLGLVLPALAQAETGAAITVNKDTLEPAQDIITATMSVAASKTDVAAVTDASDAENTQAGIEDEEETKTNAKEAKATETNAEGSNESGTETGVATGTETGDGESETGTETGDSTEATETGEDDEYGEEYEETEAGDSTTDSSDTEDASATDSWSTDTDAGVVDVPATDVPNINEEESTAVSFHDPGFIALSFATGMMMMGMMLV
jgi:hypothetical protein